MAGEETGTAALPEVGTMGDDNKTDGLTVEQKKNIGGLLFWSFVVLVLLSHCRVFREGEGDAAVYVFTLSRKSGWNLFPATIVTEGGNIHLKAFASVDHPNGYLEWIRTGNNRVAFNLVVNGNVIDKNISYIGIRGSKITRLGSKRETPLTFKVDGVPFKIIQYAAKEEYPYPEDSHLQIVGFDDFSLRDGTTVKLVSMSDYCFLKMKEQIWELYHRSEDETFLISNPEWEEPLRVHEISFEPHFGALVDYKLVPEPPEQGGTTEEMTGER